MSLDPVVADQLRNAVWRVSLRNDRSVIRGTAFFIAPGVAVTCAHATAAGETLLLCRDDAEFEVAPDAISIPADPATLDLAVLSIEDGPMPVLACLSERSESEVYWSRGYSSAAPRGRASLYEARGPFDATYEADRAYVIDGAIEVAGDMAEPGFSGSPAVVPSATASIGVISGGHARVGRSWVIPFSLARGRFPELEAALAWNSANLPAYGTALNDLALDTLLVAASIETTRHLSEVKLYNASLNVARPSVRATIAAFLRADQPLLMIVGAAGTGKSWLLADEVASGRLPGAVLLRATELERSQPTPLVTWLTHVLAGVGAPASLPSQETMEALYRRRETRTIVLVDGLNEAADVRNFVDDWFPDAVRWCRRNRIKLICTTRPELWPDFAGALDSPSTDLFLPSEVSGSELDQAVRQSSAEERCLALRGFDQAEAKTAAEYYALPDQLLGMLRGHPLLYRIAVRLGLNAPDAKIGRVGLLRAYVEVSLADQFGRLGHSSTLPLRRTLERIAAAIAESSAGSIAWSEAEALVSLGVLDALLASGLLVAATDRVRFQFDDLIGALAPSTIAPSALFDEPACNDPWLGQRHADNLLRREADGDESGFLEGLAALLKALEEIADDDTPGMSIFGRMRFAELATRVATALPSCRAAEIERIYLVLTKFAALAVKTYRFSDLAQWIERAPLSAERRAELLVKVAVFGDAWPFRAKDWMDEDRRSSFEISLSRPEPDHVGAALTTLLETHFSQVAPILASALCDTRLIDRGNGTDRGETDVGTMVAGLLFHQRNQHITELLEIAYRSEAQAARYLGEALARSHPLQSFEALCTSIEGLPHLGTAIYLFGVAVDQLRTGGCFLAVQRDAAVRSLSRICSSQAPHFSEAARLWREIDPTDLEAWEYAAMAVRSGIPWTGSYLHPVPEGLLERALEVVELNPAEGLRWIEVHDGPIAEQARLAETALFWYQTGRISAYRFANLIEGKLHLRGGIFKEDQAPWLTMTRHVVASGDDAARRCLIHLVGFVDLEANPEIAEIEVELLASGLDRGEIELFAVKLVEQAKWSDPFWLNRIQRFRALAPDLWDAQMLVRLRRRSPQALLDFWSALPTAQRGAIAARMLQRTAEDEPLDKLFSFDSVHDVVRSLSGHHSTD